jgi:hypothetical protein
VFDLHGSVAVAESRHQRESPEQTSALLVAVAAVENLDQQERVHQVKGHDDRIAAIAREYAKSPNGTLVVSPDNRSRGEINQRIHVELQSRGVVNKQEQLVRTLVPRQELTGADRSWAQQYRVDDILRYSRSSKETGIKRDEYGLGL